MIFLVCFAIGVALAWYENKFIVLDIVRRPLFLSTATNQAALYIVRLLVTYGSLVGLFFSYGPVSALAAFLTYWIISWATFRTYFNREVSRVAKVLLASDFRDDSPEKGSESEAFERATRFVEGNIKTAGRGAGF